MSEPKKHHFVPQAYLKFFSKDKKRHFFEVKVKSKHKSTITAKHTSEVCFEHFYFTLQKQETLTEYNLSDKNFIEKNVNYIHEKQIDNLFKIFEKRAPVIYRQNAERLIKFYLHLKHRNPVFRSEYLKEELFEISWQQISGQLSLEKNLIEDMVAMPFDDFMIRTKNNITQNIIKSEQGKKEMHNKSLLKAYSGNDQNTEAICQALIKLRFTVFVAPSNSFFITSDNPGFTIFHENGSELISNTNFDSFLGVLLPISSRMALFIGITDLSNMYSIEKPINYQPIDDTTVRLINSSTALMARKSIFCEDSNYLNLFISYFRQEYQRRGVQ